MANLNNTQLAQVKQLLDEELQTQADNFTSKLQQTEKKAADDLAAARAQAAADLAVLGRDNEALQAQVQQLESTRGQAAASLVVGKRAEALAAWPSMDGTDMENRILVQKGTATKEVYAELVVADSFLNMEPPDLDAARKAVSIGVHLAHTVGEAILMAKEQPALKAQFVDSYYEFKKGEARSAGSKRGPEHGIPTEMKLRREDSKHVAKTLGIVPKTAQLPGAGRQGPGRDQRGNRGGNFQPGPNHNQQNYRDRTQQPPWQGQQNRQQIPQGFIAPGNGGPPRQGGFTGNAFSGQRPGN